VPEIQVPIVGGDYQGVVRSLNSQRTVNLYPVPGGPGGKTVAALRTVPGLSLFARLPGTGAIRGQIEFNGALLVVQGAYLYVVSTGGVVSAAVATLNSTVGRVDLASNGLNVLIVDGVDGYLWDGAVLSVIDDPYFPGVGDTFAPTACACANHVYVVNDPSYPGRFYVSEPLAAGARWGLQVSGTTNQFKDVVWSGSLFVAVGTLGTIVTSPTGLTWTLHTSGTTNALRAAVWSGSLFVAVGDVGKIVTSPDGVTWTLRASGTTNVLHRVVWSGSLFVAAGNIGTIVTSPDGVTWTVRASGTTNTLYDVVWSGSLFVAVGEVGTIVTSPTGSTWTVGASGTTNALYDVVWSGSLFVAVGNIGTIVTSPDGVTWTVRASGTTNALYDVAWSGSLFVAVGEVGTIVTSSTGSTWTVGASGTTNVLYDVVWSGSLFVAVGAGGTITTSPSGLTWTVGASGTANALYRVVWSGSLFVAVGNIGTIVTNEVRSFIGGQGTAWATAESSPDALVRIVAHGGRMWLFGSRTVEQWYPSGASAVIFDPTPGGALDLGCASPGAVATTGESLLYVSVDKAGKVALVRSGAGDVATIPVSGMLAEHMTDLADATGLTFAHDGHEFYQLNLPDTSFVYDLTTGMWHERAAWVAATAAYTRHPADSALLFANKVVLTAHDHGDLYLLDSSVHAMDEGPLRWERVSAPVAAGNRWLFWRRLTLDLETGLAGVDTPGAVVMLQWSDDGGRTWSAARALKTGNAGQYGRLVQVHRLGRSRQRMFRVYGSDPVPVHILGALVDVTG